MNPRLRRRLDEIAPIITEPGFLSGSGTGNEIACHIFDYAPEDELFVRDYIENLGNQLTSNHSKLNCCHINLFDAMTGYLETRQLLGKAIEMQKKKGDAGLIKALAGPLAAEKLSAYLIEQHNPAEQDLILLSRIGSVWPVVRLHSLLNCLHKSLDGTPMVIFYPGTFDGTSLNLFSRRDTQEAEGAYNAGVQRYYRAFRLVPESE